MTNKEKALRLVWEHWKKISLSEKSFEWFVRNMFEFYNSRNLSIQHAKLTATKIAEYNPEEGEVLLEELSKL